MGDSSASYIHLVHRLIETCLTFHMSKEECMEALSKHGNIEPVITSTVWNELEKENKEFFEGYSQSHSKPDPVSEEETTQLIQKIISDSSKDSDD
ncbi:putative angiotensin-converting enzyme 2 [Fagus crenata]